MEYNFKEIESKWQNVWYTQNTFAQNRIFHFLSITALLSSLIRQVRDFM